MCDVAKSLAADVRVDNFICRDLHAYVDSSSDGLGHSYLGGVSHALVEEHGVLCWVVSSWHPPVLWFSDAGTSEHSCTSPVLWFSRCTCTGALCTSAADAVAVVWGDL